MDEKDEKLRKFMFRVVQENEVIGRDAVDSHIVYEGWVAGSTR